MQYLYLSLTLFFGAALGYVYRLLKSYSSRPFEEADERRKTFLGPTREIPDNVTHMMSWVPNSEGQLVFQQQFIPDNFTAVIIFIHGYGDHAHHMALTIILDFCKEGFAVIAMDAIGHGVSDGLHGHCENLDHVVRDYHDYILSQHQRPVFQDKAFFVYGQSSK